MRHAIATVLIYTIVPITLFLLANTRFDSSKKVYVYPKFVSIIGAVGMFFTGVCFFGLLFQTMQGEETVHPIAGTILLSLVLCLHFGMIYLVLVRKKWKIELLEDGFTYRNYLGKLKTYKYSEVIEIKEYYEKGTSTIKKYKIQLKNKSITVDYLIVGHLDLLKQIKREVKKNQKTK